MQPDRNPSAFSARTLGYDAGLRAYFQRVYNVMAFGLVLTGVVAFGVAHSPMLLSLFFGNPVMRMVVMLSPLAFVFFGFSGARVQTMSAQQLTMLFAGFSALLGLSLSTIFLVYTNESIARTFFISASMFAATSIFGYTTKRDLTNFGSIMFMGMIGIVIASLVNMFLHSPALQYAVSLVGVGVFTGLIAWDTQYLKQVYGYGGASLEATNKMAVMGALRLYINFINLFTVMLRFTGSRR